MADLLTAEELAALSGKPLRTVQRHCREGFIPGVTWKAGRWLIPGVVARDYAKNHERYQRLGQRKPDESEE